MKRTLFQMACCAAMLFALLGSRAAAQEKTLVDLWRDFAMRYLEPAPHMALAKYFLDHGNRLLAFNIL